MRVLAGWFAGLCDGLGCLFWFWRASGVFCAETAMVFGLLTLPPPLPFLALRASCSSPAADASASCRGGGGSVEGWLFGCRFGLCVWSLLRGLWCAETAMVFGLLPLPPPQPSPAAGFALQGREWFGGGMLSGCRFGVAGGYGLRPNRPYVCRVTRFALIQPAPLFALAFIHTLERSRCM